MRIAFFSDTYLPQVNGVVTCVAHLAEELGRQGHHVLIVCPKSPGTLPTMPKHVEVLTVHSLPAMLYPQFRIGILPSPTLLAAIRKFRPDIVHFHTPLTLGLLAIATAKLLGVPLVGTNHLYLTKENDDFLKSMNSNPAFVRGASKVIRLYSRMMYNFCDLVVVPSARLLEALREESPRNETICVPNPIAIPGKQVLSAKHRELLRKKYHLRSFVVLHTGRLSAEKNVDEVLKGFMLFAKSVPEASLLVVGDGPTKKYLERMAKKSGLEDRIRFTGFIAHDELLASGLVALGDVFMTASTMENQPMAVLEAMAFGLPVVAVDAAGMPDLVRGNGMLSRSHDVRAMSEALLTLFHEASLRSTLGLRSRTIALEHDVNAVVRTLVQRYQALVGSR